MLYIESPTGVGWSKAEREDRMHTDYSQSEDLRAGLEKFYERHPKMLKNDLWIVGESYTGIYAPYLVWQLHLYNQNQSSPFKFL